MIKKFTCSNGVRIVLEEIPTVRSVSIGIWVTPDQGMKRRS